jgi:uncharacterized protein (TIGR01777 family)
VKVTIAGATGLLGTALTKALRADGHNVVPLSRKAGRVADIPTTVWDPATSQLPGAACEGVDAFVNLAGVGIADGRWDAAHRRAIVDSRVTTTRRLVEAMKLGPPATFISGSAIGYYGPGEGPVDETAPAGHDFLAGVCVQWESEAAKAKDVTNLVILRTGIVLSRDGGALPRLLRPARLGVGGPLGSGRQWQSWIHIDDEVGLVRYLLTHPSVSGPVNATAPNPVRQAQMAQTLGHLLHRPAVVPTPAFALRLVLGGAAEMALTGQCVLPTVALRSGYEFVYRDLEPALRNLLQLGTG